MRRKRFVCPMQRVGGWCEPMQAEAYTGGLAERKVGRTGDARYSVTRLLDRGEGPDFQARRVVPQGFYALSLSMERDRAFFYVRFPYPVPFTKSKF